MSSSCEPEKFELSCNRLEAVIQAALLEAEPSTPAMDGDALAPLFGTRAAELKNMLPTAIMAYCARMSKVSFGLAVANAINYYFATLLKTCPSANKHTMIMMLCNQLMVWLDLSLLYDGDHVTVPELIPDNYVAKPFNLKECVTVGHDIDRACTLKRAIEDYFVGALASYFASDDKMRIATVQYSVIMFLCDALMRFILTY